MVRSASARPITTSPSIGIERPAAGPDLTVSLGKASRDYFGTGGEVKRC